MEGGGERIGDRRGVEWRGGEGRGGEWRGVEGRRVEWSGVEWRGGESHVKFEEYSNALLHIHIMYHTTTIYCSEFTSVQMQNI